MQDAVRHQLAHQEPQILRSRQVLLVDELIYCVPCSPDGLRPAMQLNRHQMNPLSCVA
jgi:hypothetical protein